MHGHIFSVVFFGGVSFLCILLHTIIAFCQPSIKKKLTRLLTVRLHAKIERKYYVYDVKRKMWSYKFYKEKNLDISEFHRLQSKE